MYDLLVKAGDVIDTTEGIHGPMDIGISDGKIACLAPEIGPDQAKRVIDVKDKIVTPGLIDVHAHVTDGLTPIGIHPDEDGVFSGVTTVCDGGSTGYANLPGFKKFVIAPAQTDVFCLLSLHSMGQAIMPELWSWRDVNAEAILRTIDENRDLVKGIKVRAVCAVAETLGIALIRRAKQIADQAGVPLMVHVGKDPVEECSADILDSLTRELLCLLDKGDILTHIYTPKLGQVIKPDGSVLPELSEAIERGVDLDLAQGSGNLSFKIAKEALSQGILPSTLSTDLSTFFEPRGHVLTQLMSTFLALGVSLEKVIEMVTANPARILREEQRRGSLRVGMPADISILHLHAGRFTFTDSLKDRTVGNSLLTPHRTLKTGREIHPRPHQENRNKGID
jgi:dihydroorotase